MSSCRQSGRALHTGCRRTWGKATAHMHSRSQAQHQKPRHLTCVPANQNKSSLYSSRASGSNTRQLSSLCSYKRKRKSNATQQNAHQTDGRAPARAIKLQPPRALQRLGRAAAARAASPESQLSWVWERAGASGRDSEARGRARTQARRCPAARRRRVSRYRSRRPHPGNPSCTAPRRRILS